MTNNILKFVLAAACIIVGYLCYDTIATTLRYEAQVKYVETDIIKRLTEIKEAEFAYKEAYGSFTKNFDTLIYGLKNGKIAEVKQVGEYVEGEENNVQIDTLYVPITEKLKNTVQNFDSLRYVPHSNKVEFALDAGRINRNGVEIQVFEAKDPKPYNAKKALRIGSMVDAVFTGNWEKQE